jgi:Protein of unknown function (DUF2799)
MRVLYVTVCGVLIALLGACAAMTPEECRQSQWGDVGLRDGLAGEPLSRLNQLSKDCAEAKVAVDTPAYLQGRDRGLSTYCRIDNAPALGLAGKSYQGVCPAGVHGEFRRRFELGREVYEARQQLRSQDSRRAGLERRLSEAKSDEDKRRLRNELSELDSSLRRNRDRVRDAEWQFDRMR